MKIFFATNARMKFNHRLHRLTLIKHRFTLIQNYVRHPWEKLKRIKQDWLIGED